MTPPPTTIAQAPARAPAHVALYWTLPVPWAGFTTLSADPAVAATQSRTIAYQRARIRRWVAEDGGTLAHERVFLEIAPDRGSELIGPVLDDLHRRAREGGGQVLLVEFWSAWGWRRHGPLAEWIEAHPADVLLLDPDPILDNAGAFDPADHFRAWRAMTYTFAGGKPARRQAAAAALASLPDLPAADLAARLNAEGVPTPTGKRWTASNVKAFVRSL